MGNRPCTIQKCYIWAIGSTFILFSSSVATLCMNPHIIRVKNYYLFALTQVYLSGSWTFLFICREDRRTLSIFVFAVFTTCSGVKVFWDHHVTCSNGQSWKVCNSGTIVAQQADYLTCVCTRHASIVQSSGGVRGWRAHLCFHGLQTSWEKPWYDLSLSVSPHSIAQSPQAWQSWSSLFFPLSISPLTPTLLPFFLSPY